MNEFITNASSPSWWVGVVIVGVIVSIVGAFLKEYIERGMSYLFTSWKERKNSSKEAYENRIRSLIDSSELRDEYRFETIRNLIVALIFMVLSVIIFSVSSFLIGVGLLKPIYSIAILAIAAFSFVRGFSKLMDDKYMILVEAERRRMRNA